MAIDMMKENVAMSGKLPEGTYTLRLDSITLFEKVVTVSKKYLGEELSKQVAGKEISQLTEEQIKRINAIDMGEDGTFDDGRAKPRFQNTIRFAFSEKISGNSLNINMFGGPKINAKLAALIKQMTDIDIDKNIGQSWANLFKIGEYYTARVVEKGDYNNIDATTIRRSDLPAISSDEQQSSKELTNAEKALIKYLNAQTPQLKTSDIAQIHTKGITVDGISFSDFAQVASLWSSIKGKVQSYKDEAGNILIVE